jgi:hypothetical protein
MICRTFVHILLDYVALAQALVTGQFEVARGIFMAHIWLIGHMGLIAKERKKVQVRRKVSDKIVDKNMYQGSIVWAYFGKKIKTYQQLINK